MIPLFIRTAKKDNHPVPRLPVFCKNYDFGTGYTKMVDEFRDGKIDSVDDFIKKKRKEPSPIKEWKERRGKRKKKIAALLDHLDLSEYEISAFADDGGGDGGGGEGSDGDYAGSDNYYGYGYGGYWGGPSLGYSGHLTRYRKKPSKKKHKKPNSTEKWKERRKKRKKKVSELLLAINKLAFQITVNPEEPLVQKAIQLVEQKWPGLLKDVENIVVEPGEPAHFGQVRSDKPKEINISVNKTKTTLGPNATEQDIIEQLAQTLAHEVGHLERKFQGGEAPAEAKEQQFKSRLGT